MSFDLEALDRFQDTGYPFIPALLFPVAQANIAVIAIVTDQLFSLVGNMREHDR
jgi:hypothetical protein